MTKSFSRTSLIALAVLFIQIVWFAGIQSHAQVGTVRDEQKISATSGGLTGGLDTEDRFGSSVTNIGDVDNDGVTDIAVGVVMDDDGPGIDRGAVYVLLLNTDGTVKAEQKISDTSGGLTGSLDDYDSFGISVASIGDLDNDNVPDIAVGAIGDGDGGSNRGAVYILFLNSNGTVKAEQKISSTAGGLTGPIDNFDRFGESITSLGDFDNDGVTDIVVGALRDGDGGVSFGALYVLLLNSNGTVKSEQKISATAGGFAGGLEFNDEFGISVASLGDLDEDGITDIAAGSFGDDDGITNAGAVYIIFLNANGTVKSHQKISATSGSFTGPLTNTNRFGRAIANVGDVDSDGVVDIAVTAENDNDGGFGRGGLYILFLNTNGTVKAEQKISSTTGGFMGGLDNSDRFGSAVSSVGDLDGDGFTDIAVGADLDDDGNPQAGATYIMFMSGPPGITVTESGGSTDVVEGGATDTVEYVLDTEPTADVTITIAAHPQLDFGSGVNTAHVLTFTTANWDIPQTVTVTADDDVVTEGDHAGTMVHTVSSADTNYNPLTIADINVNITDNEALTATINQAPSQEDPTNINTAEFTLVFSEAIDPATFDASDITLSGTTGTIQTDPVSNDNITWTFVVTGLTDGDTVVASLNSGAVATLTGASNQTAGSTDNEVTYNQPAMPSDLTLIRTGGTNNSSIMVAVMFLLAGSMLGGVSFYNLKRN